MFDINEVLRYELFFNFQKIIHKYIVFQHYIVRL